MTRLVVKGGWEKNSDHNGHFIIYMYTVGY